MVSSLTGQGIKAENIRGQERKTGINAEDLAIIRALALSTKADLKGDNLGSLELLFFPLHTPKPLSAEIKVHEIIKGKGDLTPILSTLLPVLAKTWGYSQLNIITHTHPLSEVNYDFFEHLVLNLYKKQGLYAFSNLRSTTFDKKSMGEVYVEVEPSSYLGNLWEERGKIKNIKIVLCEGGLLPKTQKDIIACVSGLLKGHSVEPFIQIIPLNSKTIGFSLTLVAEFERGLGGFSFCQNDLDSFEDDIQKLYGEFEEWLNSQTTLSPNLLPYALIPMVFSKESSVLTTSKLTPEAQTIIWTLKQIIPLKLTVTKSADKNFKISFQPS